MFHMIRITKEYEYSQSCTAAVATAMSATATSSRIKLTPNSERKKLWHCAHSFPPSTRWLPPSHSRHSGPGPSRVDQHVAIGMATERSVTTRLKDSPLCIPPHGGCWPSGGILPPGQLPCCGQEKMLQTCASGGSACCHWSRYGSSVTTRLNHT